MSAVVSQLQQDIQTEFTAANQLLHLISLEVKEIKELTKPGGEFDANVKNNATLASTLAAIQNINIALENLPPPPRMDVQICNESNQNSSCQQHDTFRDITNIDHSM